MAPGGAPGAFTGSLGFVVEESDPGSAGAFCEVVTRSVPDGIGIEFLVLDDHTNPQRRQLVREVDARGDSTRLVPRPRERTAELDAVSLSAGSDFIVLSSGPGAPWPAVPRAVEELWADGADVVIVGDVGGLPPRGGDGSSGGDAFVPYLRLCVDRGSAAGAGWFLVVRRWVARWLFSEPVRGTDVHVEITTRADSLGLQMLVLDAEGVPVGRG